MSSVLTKSEKKLSRELIDKGLQQEYEKAIVELDGLITAWKNKKSPTRETYLAVFSALHDHDKHIAWRYDGMRGSRYLDTVAGLLADGLITEEDISGFKEENVDYLRRYLQVRNSFR